MSEKLNKVSSRITQPRSQGASQAMLYATGMTRADMDKAQVGIASMWWEGNRCNMHSNARAGQAAEDRGQKHEPGHRAQSDFAFTVKARQIQAKQAH